MSSTAQDSSADSNIWNTQGPSANHGSINFNFHVNNENYTSPMGSTEGHAGNRQYLEQLMQQNRALKNILSQIAPSLMPQGERRKRSTEDTPPSRRGEWHHLPRLTGGIRGKRFNRTVVCVRPSPNCPPRTPKHEKTTARPFVPLPLLGSEHKPSECVLRYFEKALSTYRGYQPHYYNNLKNGIRGK